MRSSVHRRCSYRDVVTSLTKMTEREISVDEKFRFTVEVPNAGNAEFGVAVTKPNGENEEVKQESMASGQHLQYSFTPKDPGLYSVLICFAGMNIAGSPFKLNAKQNQASSCPSAGRISEDSRVSGQVPATGRPVDIIEENVVVPEGLRHHVKEVTVFELKQKLGEGEFGIVAEARVAFDTKCAKTYAAKTIKPGGKHDELFVEADTMKGFKHTNVMSLEGIVIFEDKPYLLMPLMSLGTLKRYLQENKHKIKKTAVLINYAYQVASGMQYLSELQFIHRDLAARNCLLNDQDVVKIADFGLTRNILEKNYVMTNRKKKVPWKWMAPEVWETLEFTMENDVWSYGVLLWEIFSYGKEPYPTLPGSQIVEYLKTGRRLARPEAASDEVYELMRQCWKSDPVCRPSFVNVAQILKAACEKEGGHVISYKN